MPLGMGDHGVFMKEPRSTNRRDQSSRYEVWFDVTSEADGSIAAVLYDDRCSFPDAFDVKPKSGIAVTLGIITMDNTAKSFAGTIATFGATEDYYIILYGDTMKELNA